MIQCSIKQLYKTVLNRPEINKEEYTCTNNSQVISLKQVQELESIKLFTLFIENECFRAFFCMYFSYSVINNLPVMVTFSITLQAGIQ